MLLSRFKPIDFASFQVQTDRNLGVIEVGTFVSLTLFGILLAQAYSFFCRSKEYSSGLKLLVSSLVFLETVHTSFISAVIYYDTVTTWRNPTVNTYPLSMATIIENVITTMVQFCFARRICLLSGGRSYTASACFILAVLRSMGVFVMGVISLRDVIVDGGTGIFVVRMSWLITSGLAVGGAADILIAASMIYYLRKLSSPMNLKSTGQIINGLMRWSVQTGLVTSLAHLATIICTMKGLVWLAIYIVLAKLYSNSLLMILNARPVNGTTVDLCDVSSVKFGEDTPAGKGTSKPLQLSHLGHDASFAASSLWKSERVTQLPNPVETL